MILYNCAEGKTNHMCVVLTYQKSSIPRKIGQIHQRLVVAVEFPLMADCPCVSLMLPRTVLLSKKLFHFLLTYIPSFILKSPSSFSMGIFWPIPHEPLPLSQDRSQQQCNVQGRVPLSLAQLKFRG